MLWRRALPPRTGDLHHGSGGRSRRRRKEPDDDGAETRDDRATPAARGGPRDRVAGRGAVGGAGRAREGRRGLRRLEEELRVPAVARAAGWTLSYRGIATPGRCPIARRTA